METPTPSDGEKIAEEKIMKEAVEEAADAANEVKAKGPRGTNGLNGTRETVGQKTVKENVAKLEKEKAKKELTIEKQSKGENEIKIHEEEQRYKALEEPLTSKSLKNEELVNMIKSLNEKISTWNKELIREQKGSENFETEANKAFKAKGNETGEELVKRCAIKEEFISSRIKRKTDRNSFEGLIVSMDQISVKVGVAVEPKVFPLVDEFKGSGVKELEIQHIVQGDMEGIGVAEGSSYVRRCDGYDQFDPGGTYKHINPTGIRGWVEEVLRTINGAGRLGKGPQFSGGNNVELVPN